MNEPTLSTVVQLVRPDVETPKDVRDDAFRLWVATGRSARLVAERFGCTTQTVYNWARRDDWEQRRLDQAASYLPGMRPESAAAMTIAAHNAAVRLQQITYAALEYGEPFDPKEVDALVKVVKAGGAEILPAQPAPPDPEPDRILSPDQLAAIRSRLTGSDD